MYAYLEREPDGETSKQPNGKRERRREVRLDLRRAVVVDEYLPANNRFTPPNDQSV
jgi:hypothetical protein